MKRTMSRFMAIAMVFSMIFVPETILAEDEVSTVTKETVIEDELTLEEYTDLFSDAMEFVKDVSLDNEVTYEKLFEAAMEGMLDSLDPYSEFMTLEESDEFTSAIDQSFVGIGVRLENISGENRVSEVFDDSPAIEVGVQAGDIFKMVDGIDVMAYSLGELVDLLLGEEGSTVNIVFLRDGEEVEFNIIRAQVSVPTVTRGELSELYAGTNEGVLNQAAYVKISSFGDQTDEDFAAILEDFDDETIEYLIIDLRDNSGGYVSSAINICNDIVPEGEIVRFTNKYDQSQIYTSALLEAPYEIITLVNENSASASEIVSSAIQDSEVGVLVGETTYGKGVSQYLISLSDKYEIKLTGQEFISRNGNKIHGIGVTPDYIVDNPEYVISERRFYKSDNFEEVLDAELILDYLGYEVGVPDTLYDEMTYQAVKQFQSDQGLYSYGVCDYTTQDYLNLALYEAFMANDEQLEKAFEVIEERVNAQ